MTAVRCFIGLGSNLDHPERQLETALEAIRILDRCVLAAVSEFYRSKAIGPGDQPDYCNAVAEMRTELNPHDLLDRLQMIERKQGRLRVPGERWTPRTLDLDILLYGQNQISDDRLQIPHPGIAERNFVVFPLMDLVDDIEIPGQGLLSDIGQTLQTGDLQHWGQNS